MSAAGSVVYLAENQMIEIACLGSAQPVTDPGQERYWIGNLISELFWRKINTVSWTELSSPEMVF